MGSRWGLMMAWKSNPKGWLKATNSDWRLETSKVTPRATRLETLTGWCSAMRTAMRLAR